MPSSNFICMSKKVKIILYLVIALQLAGCSMAQNYILDSTSTLFTTPAKAISAPPVLLYDFIQPRRSKLSQASTKRLDEVSTKQDGYSYYSASGYPCYAPPETALSNTCYINGQWQALADILHPYE